AVRVTDRHADDRDRSVDAAERRDARNPAAGADDDLAPDLFPEDAIRGADVAPPLGSDRRRLERQPLLADRRRRLVHDAVVGLAAPFEREVEAREVELDADHIELENAQALLQQLLPGLVALEDDDGPLVAHRRPV